MFFGKFSFYSRFLFIGIFVLLPILAKAESCIFIPVDPNMELCPIMGTGYNGDSISKQLQDMVCPFLSLREAMADERMAQIIAGKNVFQTIESNDVVRLEEGVGGYVVLNPLKKKINKTYKDFYEVAQADFTLNVTTYPADVQTGTCTNHSTIIKRPISENAQKNLEKIEPILLEEGQLQDTSETLGVKREVSGVFGNYETVEGKTPRHFELRKGQDEKIIICEVSKNSLQERVALYCGDSNEDQDKCEGQMPPLCSDWDENNAEFAGRKHSCATLDAFEKVSGNFLRHNMTMQQFCPDDCSYYMQLLQRVRKRGDEQCTESRAIIHCGPKKTKRDYNLNIKVVDDFCEDFNVMCVPTNQVSSDKTEPAI